MGNTSLVHSPLMIIAMCANESKSVNLFRFGALLSPPSKEFGYSPKIRKQSLWTRMLRIGAFWKPSCSTHTHNLMGLRGSWGVVGFGTTTGIVDAGTSGFPAPHGLSRLLPPSSAHG